MIYCEPVEKIITEDERLRELLIAAAIMELDRDRADELTGQRDRQLKMNGEG